MEDEKEKLAQIAKCLCGDFDTNYCNKECPDQCTCMIKTHAQELCYNDYCKKSDAIKEFTDRFKEIYPNLYGFVMYVAAEYGLEIEE